MQRLYPANSGSNNGMHNRSIFTITQTFFHLSEHHSLFLSFRLMQMSKQTVQFYTYYSTFYSFLLICKRVMKKTVPMYIYLPIFHLIYFVLFHILTVLIRYGARVPWAVAPKRRASLKISHCVQPPDTAIDAHDF